MSELQLTRIDEIWKILTGNGHPSTGLIYKVERLKLILFLVVALSAGNLGVDIFKLLTL